MQFLSLLKQRKHLFETIVTSLFITIYTIGAILVSLHRHWQYNSFWYDFGILDTTIWKLSRFQLPLIHQLNPPLGKIVWADHFNPSSIFLAPLYWFTDHEEILLVAQAIIVGACGFIVHRIALRMIKSTIVRISLVVSFLGYVGLQNALYTDIHNIVFALLPLMLTIWAIYQKKWKTYWIFLFITMGFQENLAALAASLGLFLLIRKDRNIKIGAMTIGISLLYGLFAMKVLIPLLNGGTYAYQPSIPPIWHGWISEFIYPIDLKLKSIVVTYATFGFMPLASIATFPLTIDHYLERFVLNRAATRWDLGFHYNAVLSPIMFLASMEAIRFFQNKKFFKKIMALWGGCTILMVVFLHRFYIHGPLMLATHPAFYQQTKNTAFLNEFENNIPRDGLLMIQNNMAAHFTHQDTILLNHRYKELKPHVIAVDIRQGQNANNFFPLSPAETDMLVASISADQSYSKKIINETQWVFIRK